MQYPETEYVFDHFYDYVTESLQQQVHLKLLF
jgi:hypothetical protein